jgi:dolichol-phosphate mannosyltransferase
MRRWAAVTAVATAIDLAALAGLVAAGQRLASAHLFSYALAVSTSAWLYVRWALRASGAAAGLAGIGCFLTACGLALFLRAAALAACLRLGGGAPRLAGMLAAVGVSASVGYGGAALFAFRARPVRWQGAALGLVAYALALRLAYLGLIDLIPEEAYYWNYAQHLDFGYLDHPPLVAWLIRLGTLAFGHSEFAVRIGALACWLVAAGFAYGLARAAYGRAAGLAALLLLSVLPYFFAVGLVMTPDAPLVAAWSGALFFLARALLFGRARAWWGAGACLGIGLLSKYSIGLLGVAALCFVLGDPPSRRWLRRPEPYAAAALAALLFSPVIVWNAEHGWASFAFQSARRLAKTPELGLPWLVASAALLLTPLGLGAALVALLGRGERAGIDTDARRFRRFALVFTGVPLAVLAAFSLRHEVRTNWTGPVWLAALPEMARGLAVQASAATPQLGAIARTWAATLLALLLLYGAVLQYLTLGLPGVGFLAELRLPVGWRELGAEVDAIAGELERESGRRPLLHHQRARLLRSRRRGGGGGGPASLRPTRSDVRALVARRRARRPTAGAGGLRPRRSRGPGGGPLCRGARADARAPPRARRPARRPLLLARGPPLSRAARRLRGVTQFTARCPAPGLASRRITKRRVRWPSGSGCSSESGFADRNRGFGRSSRRRPSGLWDERPRHRTCPRDPTCHAARRRSAKRIG